MASVLIGTQIGGMDLRPRDQSGGAAGATHVQISWISAWIPSEVTRTFFFDLPIYGIQIQVHFHVGHFLAKGNQQLLVPLPDAMISKLTDAYMRHQWTGRSTLVQMMVYRLIQYVN